MSLEREALDKRGKRDGGKRRPTQRRSVLYLSDNQVRSAAVNIYFPRYGQYNRLNGVRSMTENRWLEEPTHTELSLFWSSKLVEAKARYQRMAARFREAAEERERILMANTEGGDATRRALEEELAALREYRRVMTVFTAVVLQGTAQPEE